MNTKGNQQQALLIQAALNGDRTKAEHEAVPFSIQELTLAAVACVAAGAGAIHLHPRDIDGRERLDPEIVDEVVATVRNACGVPVGVTTGEWIEPDLKRRLAMIRAWRMPDYSSVNLSEQGSIEVMSALIDAGVGIEAGVWTVEDVERLAASGFADRITRVLVEPGEAQVGEDVDAAIKLVDEINIALDRHSIMAPRLQHADGHVTWAVLTDAIRRGLDTRVGLEDTLFEPDGKRTEGNTSLIRRAVDIAAHERTQSS
ncbi:MAG: 3-keto-5-aminohexanoate cleavage protein [Thermomicrobiales bacterium]